MTWDAIQAMNDKIESITADICLWDPNMTLEAYKATIEKKFKLKVEVLAEAGSGGGNPIIRVTGPVKSLEKWFVKDYCGETTMKGALESIGCQSFDEMLDSHE